MGVKIISFENKYLERIIEITVASWQPIYDGYKAVMGEKMFNDLHGDWKERKCNHVCAGITSGRGYVALLDGKVAGFIFYSINEFKKTGIIEENAVDPKFRGFGIAGKMYDFVLDKMRSEGMEYSMVTTGLDDAHLGARKAYEKVGFSKSIESINYYMELF